METGYSNGGGANVPALANPRPNYGTANGRPKHHTDEYLTKMFVKWDQSLDMHWSGWRVEAKEAYDITASRQWDKDAENWAEDMRLTNISINKVDTTVSAICGSEMTNRHEVKYYPREMSTHGPDGKPQDAAVNEIFSAAAEWVRDECDAADEESEAFRDMVICGIGCVETRMEYETDAEGRVLIRRVDPMEMAICADGGPSPNAVDAMYVRRKKPFSPEEAKTKFGVDQGEGAWGNAGSSQPHRNWPGSSYSHADNEHSAKDEVWISEYQWWELETVHRVLNPNTRQIEEISDEDFKRLVKRLPELEEMSLTTKVRRYYRAFSIADRILECTPLPDDEFTYKFITGKLDRNKGVWYGVVRAMIEPQKLLNKQISQIQRIIDNNAKGGLLAEVDAFEDSEQAKLDWAASDSIVWVKPGTLGQHPRVMPKPVGNYPSGVDRLLMIANEAVPGVSGVNNEMLGIIDREQAGVVDVTRKEAAYGVLKGFFNALRRYRKVHGRHLLKLIQKYMTDGRLVRIVGRTGNVQYLPLVRDPNTARFDTIVDEAPTGPNQKDKVFQFLVQFGAPMMAKLDLPPQIWMKFLEFSPLPTALVSEMQTMMQQMPPQPNPEQEKAKGEAAKAQAAMQKMQVDAQMQQMQMQMDAQANNMKMQMEMAKLQGANQKLEVENQWVRIEMAKTQMQQQSDAQEAALRMRETAMREQNDTAKISADIEKMQAELEIKRAELEIKRAELGIKQSELGFKHEELGFKREELQHTSELKREEIGMKGEIEREKLDQADRHGEADREIETKKIDSKERTDTAKIDGASPKKRKSLSDERSERWGQVTKSISDLTDAIKRPRKVVRDGSGRAVGLE